MGQIIGGAAKPKRCNANQLSQVPTPAAGEHILVSSDNSMNAAGQGNFDCYIVGDGTTAATALPHQRINEDDEILTYPKIDGFSINTAYTILAYDGTQCITPFIPIDTSETSNPNTLYWKGGVMSGRCAVVLYDESYAPLDFYSANAAQKTITNTKVSQAKYIRAGFLLADIYNSYVKDSDGNYIFPVRKNVLDITKSCESRLDTIETRLFTDYAGITQNKSLNVSGQEVTAEGYMISPYIPLTSGNKAIVFYGGFTSSNSCYCCFYDASKNFVNYVAPNANPRKYAAYNNNIASAAFARFCFLKDADGVFFSSDGSVLFRWDSDMSKYLASDLNVISEYDASAEYRENDVVSAKLLTPLIDAQDIKMSAINGGVILNSTQDGGGNISPAAGYNISPKIPCAKGDVITFHTGFVTGSNHYLVTFDADGNKVSYWASNSDPRTFTENANNAAYFRFVFLASSFGSYASVNGTKMFEWTQELANAISSGASDGVGIRDNSFESVYNTTDISEKSAEYCALLNGLDDVEMFAFMTDPHFMPIGKWFGEAGTGSRTEDAYKSATSLMQKYYNTCGLQFMLCGGDWLNNSDTQAMACRKLAYITGTMKHLFPKYYPMLGNHDTNYQGVVSESDSSNGVLTQDTLRNLMFQEFGKCYYEFKGAHTRFFILDTGSDHDNTMSSYKWEQIAWLASNLASNTDEHIIIGMHIYSNSVNTWDSSTMVFAQNVQSLSAAFNERGAITLNNVAYNFAAGVGKVHCIICGHTHDDYLDTNASVPVWCTDDVGSNCTFDLMLVDYKNMVMKSVRIGTGNNRTLNLAN